MKFVGAVLCFYLCGVVVSAFKQNDRVEVSLLREIHESPREKRSADDVTNMPSSLAFRLSSGDETAVFRLQRHAPLQPRSLGSEMRAENLVDSSVYTDQSRGAALIVRRNADGEYSLDGTFTHKDEEFRISPAVRYRRASFYRKRGNRNRNPHRISLNIDKDQPALSFVGDSVFNTHRGQGGFRDQNGNSRRNQQTRDQLSRRGRGKRQAQVDHFLETAFIVDFSEYSVWVSEYGQDADTEMTLYYSFLAQSVAVRFASVKNVDPALNIEFSVSDFVVLKTTSDSGYMQSIANDQGQINGSLALDKFFDWLQERTDIPLADHYVTFTALDVYIVDGNGTFSDLAGIAYVGTVCTSSSLSITENRRDGRTPAVAAHELGHSLSAEHDQQAGCDDSDQYIMAASVPSKVSALLKNNPWNFSPCSVASFKT